MMNLTFGEQVKVVLGRKGMTIKELAELVEKHTGKPMSRQNMTQRLGRDNFQEQDMRMIAEILGCPFTLNILDAAQETPEVAAAPEAVGIPKEIHEKPVKEDKPVAEEKPNHREVARAYFEKHAPKQEKQPEKAPGEINPYTGKEYESNSVRMHPKHIGYVQVYDREQHGWTDMTEWAFMGFQERQKKELGKDYKEPIYLD